MKQENAVIIVRITEPLNPEIIVQDYYIDQKLYQGMLSLVEHMSLIGNRSANAPLEIVKVGTNIVSIHSMQTIIDLLRLFNYKIPQPAKVTSNNLIDSIHPQIARMLENFNNTMLAQLHLAAHFFKMVTLRDTVAAIFATHIYIGRNAKSYQERKKALGVNKQFTYEDSLAFKKGQESMILK